MRQARVLGLDLVQPAGHLGQRFELGDLEGQVVHAIASVLCRLLQVAQRLLRLLQCLVVGCDRGGLVLQSGIGVQQQALLGGPQQRLVRMLPVDVQQQGAQLAQCRLRGLGAVDVGARTALAHQHPAQQAKALVVQVVFPQPGRGLRAVAQVELAGHLGALAPLADHAGIGLVAEGEPQGVDQDGLARAGLAGERGHAGPQVQGQLAHDYQITNREVGQHQERDSPQPSLVRRIWKWS